MVRNFDPGYGRSAFFNLVRNCPGPETYPSQDFRIEWGPIFHRGRLDGTARVVVIGQDPGAHEAVVRRILVGEAGQRVQGFLAKLGINSSYAMINAFVYSVYGQGGGERHRDDPQIASYRNKWLDALIDRKAVEAIVALGSLAEHAFQMWKATPKGQASNAAFRRIIHPTFPEAQRSKPRAEATKDLMKNWNEALTFLRSKVKNPDFPAPSTSYGDSFDQTKDLAQIPEIDMPAGAPDWMRSLRSWAVREAVRSGDPVQEKRATLVVRIPLGERPWVQ